MGTHPALRGGGLVDDTAYVDPTAYVTGTATIGARTFIGAGAFVAGGVHVGTDCIVCGGVQVLADVPNGTIVPCPPTGVTGITPGTGIAVTGSAPGPVTVSVANGAAGVDRNTFVIGAGVVGNTNPPDWDVYNMWGLEKGFSPTAPNGRQPNKIMAIPCWFNRSGTITNIINSFVAGDFGVDSHFVLGLYANIAAGLIWPGDLIVQSTEFTLPGANSNNVINWAANHVVIAGTLLWLAMSSKETIGVTSPGASGAEWPGLMGSRVTPVAISSWSSIPFVGIDSVDSAYSTTMPTPFPLTNPNLFLGQGGGSGVPVFGFRLHI